MRSAWPECRPPQLLEEQGSSVARFKRLHSLSNPQTANRLAVPTPQRHLKCGAYNEPNANGRALARNDRRRNSAPCNFSDPQGPTALAGKRCVGPPRLTDWAGPERTVTVFEFFIQR